MPSAAKCAYCATVLNVGARVCHACTRRQPLTAQQRKVLGVLVLITMAIGGATWWAIRVVQENNEIDAACMRAELAGNSISCDEIKKMVHDLRRQGLQ